MNLQVILKTDDILITLNAKELYDDFLIGNFNLQTSLNRLTMVYTRIFHGLRITVNDNTIKFKQFLLSLIEKVSDINTKEEEVKSTNLIFNSRSTELIGMSPRKEFGVKYDSLCY